MKTNTASSAIARILLVGVLLVLACPALAGAPGTAKWVLPLGPGPDCTLTHPARATDGTVYVGCTDGNLYAINPDGTIKWVYEGGIPIATTPAVYYSPDGENAQYNGTVYVGFRNGVVLAINPWGDLIWACEAGHEVTTSLALAADGTIYAGVDDAELAAILPDGRVWWSFPTVGRGDLSDPAVGADGTVYFGTAGTDTRFYAVDTSGHAKWVRKLTEPVTSPAAIGIDGTIYFGAEFALYALYPNGDTKWRKWHDWVILSSPAIGHERTIYFGADTLIARNPDGSWEWDFWYEGTRPTTYKTSPAVDSSGLIYFGAQEGYLYTVAPGGTCVWRYHIGSGGHIDCTPLVGDDGILYFTVHNTVRALYTGSTGAFDGAWSMCGHDEQRTARQDQYSPFREWLRLLALRVNELVVDERMQRSLVAKLESAMRSYDAGLLLPAVHKIGAFIHQVEAQSGKKIPEEVADLLIRDALDILMLADGDHPWSGPCWRRWDWGRKHHRFASGCQHGPGVSSLPDSPPKRTGTSQGSRPDKL